MKETAIKRHKSHKIRKAFCDFCAFLWLFPFLASAAVFGATGDLRLIEAVKNGDIAALRSLLDQHLDINAAEPDGATALAWAAERDGIDVGNRGEASGSCPIPYRTWRRRESHVEGGLDAISVRRSTGRSGFRAVACHRRRGYRCAGARRRKEPSAYRKRRRTGTAGDF